MNQQLSKKELHIGPVPCRKKMAICLYDTETNRTEVVAYFVSPVAMKKLLEVLPAGDWRNK